MVDLINFPKPYSVKFSKKYSGITILFEDTPYPNTRRVMKRRMMKGDKNV